jgi:hypothetical protein
MSTKPKEATLGYRIKFQGNVPASLNRVMRWNHFRKTQERLMWQKAIYALLGRSRAGYLQGMACDKVRMKVTVTICNSRRYDDDNAHGACKIVFDAMRQIGLIWDDREEFLEQVVKQEKCPGKLKCTVIEIGPA